MTSRIHRGFHRIGVVLAVPLVLLAVALASYEVWLQWQSQYPWAGDPIVGLGMPTIAERFNAASYHARFKVPALIGIAAIALYIAARTIGWVIEGFMGPRDRT